MSAGVYFKGELLADTLAQGESPYIVRMRKLHISDCKRLAFTYTGDRILERHLDGLMDQFVEMIRLKELDDPQVEKLMIPKLNIANSSFILMSRERAYVYNHLGLRETDGPEMMGTHGLALLVLRQMVLPGIMKKFTKKTYEEHGADIADRLYGAMNGKVFPVEACIQTDLKPFKETKSCKK